MREILFKAKRLDNGEWVEGYLCKHPSAVQVGETSPWYIHVSPVDPDDVGGIYNVNAETVCQYTGLTDKNGVKIWEGDILEWKRKDILAGGAYALYAKYKYGHRLVVRCLPAGFMLCQLEDSFPESPSSNGKIDNYSLWNFHGFWEVVGNIYDQEDKG